MKKVWIAALCIVAFAISLTAQAEGQPQAANDLKPKMERRIMEVEAETSYGDKFLISFPKGMQDSLLNALAYVLLDMVNELRAEHGWEKMTMGQVVAALDTYMVETPTEK